jgi:hypothetical protein
MSQVIAFIEAHPPRGGNVSTTGSETRRGSITEMFIAFSWPSIRGVLWQRQLGLQAVPLGGGLLGVRADAEVEWTLPRPARERVPRGADVLTVTRSTLPGWPPPLSFSITDRSTIDRLAVMLDRLQVVQPVAVACPALFPEPTVSLTFSDASGGSQLALASMPVDGPEGSCAPIVFSVRGQREPPLYAMPSFLHRVSKVLGVSLR